MISKERLHEIIFEADTKAGRLFDIVLLFAILVSVGAVLLESMEPIRDAYGYELRLVEWIITITFSIEYVLRLYSVKRPLRYATSFYGVIDLFSILPTYISLLIPGTQALVVVRVLRLLRVFRILKLARYVGEAHLLVEALTASRRKISVFLFALLTIIVIAGSLMHVVEGPSQGFVDIPTSMYWAIVTLTTVGYGDIVPATAFGRLVASGMMILGYSIIAVPTGIVTVELGNAVTRVRSTACPDCGRSGHSVDAVYCKSCGANLRESPSSENPEA